MTSKKTASKKEKTLEQRVQEFQQEYLELCKKHGFVHQVTPVDVGDYVVTPKLKIAKLEVQDGRFE